MRTEEYKDRCRDRYVFLLILCVRVLDKAVRYHLDDVSNGLFVVVAGNADKDVGGIDFFDTFGGVAS